MGKRFGRITISLFLALFCFVMPVKAAENDGAPVSLKVSAVFGETGKMGSHIPLTISLYGQTEQAFNGTVRVRTLENGAEGSDEVYEYAYSVKVNPAETKMEEIYVPLGLRNREIHIILEDENGKRLDDRTMTFDTSTDTGRLLIGGLSDKYEEIAYFDGLNLEYGMVSSRLLPLDHATFPEDDRGLEILDVLIVNHYESEKLSEKQMEAIFQWVEQGGVLLLGSGDMAEETLAPFLKRFPEADIISSGRESVSLGVEYTEKSPGDSDVEMEYVTLFIPGGKEVMESDGMPLLTTVSRGRGKVGFLSYDLGNIREFAERNPAYVVRMLTDVLGSDTISQLYYYSSYGKEEEYWNAQSLVGAGSVDRLPNLPLYTVIAIVYILIAGPGLYLFLKKRDLSQYYGRSVVFSSLAASAVIYLLGVGTRFTSEFYTIASVMDVEKDQIKETSYLNVRTPDARPFSVRIPGEYEITPLTKPSRYEEQPVMEFDKKRNEDVGINYKGEETILSARRSRAFESRYFKLEKQTENVFSGDIQGELTFFEGKLSGYIQNTLPFPLTDGVLFLYGQMYPLGTLNPGEKREFAEESLMNWPVSMPYLVSQWISGSQKAEELEDKEYLQSVEKSSLYSYFMEEYYGVYSPGARIVGLGPEGGALEWISPEGQITDSQILYTADISVGSGKEDLVYRSGIMSPPEVSSGNGYYGDGLSIYGTDPVAVEYFLGTDIDVERVTFLWTSEEFLNEKNSYYLKLFDGNVYFYNNDTREYDPMDLNHMDLSEGELQSYLSSDNSLIVKYTVGEEDSAGMSSLLPVPMVTGRKR